MLLTVNYIERIKETRMLKHMPLKLSFLINLMAIIPPLKWSSRLEGRDRQQR